MYNRLFTKILDSSIWLEEDVTRIVWITFLAAMDEDGFCAFSCNENLARRANVPIEKLAGALDVLQSPDRHNPDDEFQGRRIERVPNGWMVLKARVYRSMMSREIQREQTRIRVAEHRARKAENPKDVTQGSLPNVTVTKVTLQKQSTASTEQSSTKQSNILSLRPKKESKKVDQNIDREKKLADFERFWNAYPRKVGKLTAAQAFYRVKIPLQTLLRAIEIQAETKQWKQDDGQFIPHPSTWLNQQRWEDTPVTAEKPRSPAFIAWQKRTNQIP